MTGSGFNSGLRTLNATTRATPTYKSSNTTLTTKQGMLICSPGSETATFSVIKAYSCGSTYYCTTWSLSYIELKDYPSNSQLSIFVRDSLNFNFILDQSYFYCLVWSINCGVGCFCTLWGRLDWWSYWRWVDFISSFFVVFGVDY